MGPVTDLLYRPAVHCPCFRQNPEQNALARQPAVTQQEATQLRGPMMSSRQAGQSRQLVSSKQVRPAKQEVSTAVLMRALASDKALQLVMHCSWQAIHKQLEMSPSQQFGRAIIPTTVVGVTATCAIVLQSDHACALVRTQASLQYYLHSTNLAGARSLGWS